VFAPENGQKFNGKPQPVRETRVVKNQLSILACLSALTLTGCQSFGGGGTPVAVAPPASRIVGDWTDADGKSVSTFGQGKFSTVVLETGEKVTEGTYVEKGPEMVEFTYFSRRSQQQVTSSCNVLDSQLNCTSSTGEKFIMLRRGAPVPTPAPATG
jgi:hypothetical protein